MTPTSLLTILTTIIDGREPAESKKDRGVTASLRLKTDPPIIFLLPFYVVGAAQIVPFAVFFVRQSNRLYKFPNFRNEKLIGRGQVRPRVFFFARASCNQFLMPQYGGPTHDSRCDRQLHSLSEHVAQKETEMSEATKICAQPDVSICSDTATIARLQIRPYDKDA